jgi:RimJ/RimL family protein N-acetyltransferase
VDDALHGKGLGTRIIEWLVDVARRNGISRFEADILPENEEMMRVLVDYGFQISSQLEDGVYRVSFPIESVID